jgi:hypothetical protein
LRVEDGSHLSTAIAGEVEATRNSAAQGDLDGGAFEVDKNTGAAVWRCTSVVTDSDGTCLSSSKATYGKR